MSAWLYMDFGIVNRSKELGLLHIFKISEV